VTVTAQLEFAWETFDVKKETALACDACGVHKYPDWSRCIRCAHYFCKVCMRNHGCGTRFRCAEDQEKGTTVLQAPSRRASRGVKEP